MKLFVAFVALVSSASINEGQNFKKHSLRMTGLIIFLGTAAMCMQCNTDPSPTCWGACARANPKKSLIDSAVMPFCMDCAKNPTNECWTACHRAAKLVKKIESPANYCMQCDTDPSPTCWGACAATIPEPQPRCMQCDTDPSPTCWGACAKAGVMVDYESPAAYCMQCDTDPSPTCWGACARGLGLAE